MNKKEIKHNFTVVALAHKTTITEGPEATVDAIIGVLGKADASVTIAEIVNTVGEWDGRISSNVRHWASTKADAATKEQLDSAGIYQPEIHPAHINQIATAMMTKEA